MGKEDLRDVNALGSGRQAVLLSAVLPVSNGTAILWSRPRIMNKETIKARRSVKMFAFR